jgi:hypothetical protein
LKSCLAALEPHTERFLQNPLNGYSADMMALVAALGGSGALSCLWSITLTAIHSGTPAAAADSFEVAMRSPPDEPAGNHVFSIVSTKGR